MKLKHLGLAAAGLLSVVTIAYAGGLWPDFPIVGGATYCSGTSASATGTIIGVVTGCPNQVAAGPTIVTGNELIPADTKLASGAVPQTVLVPMASLNALPITFVTVTLPPAGISAANTSGGTFYHSTVTITSANITLPQAPIDGQQYIVAADQKITTPSISAGALTLGNQGATPIISPTNLAVAGLGARYIYNAALSTWFRLQ